MKRSPLLRYGIAALAVGIAVLLKVLLEPVIVQETPFLLILAAIMVSAWCGGLGPGLAATGVAVLVIDYFFLPPLYTFSGLGLKAVPLGVFVLEGAVISLIVTGLRSARNRAQASALEALSHQEDLRRSEERFRLVVEGVKDYAIFMLDPAGRVVSWNAGAEGIMGYKAEEIVGEHFSCFYPGEDARRGKPEQELKVAAAEDRAEDEGWRVRKDGSRFYANVLVTALRDEDGNLRGFSQVTRDITERRRAEQRLQRSLDSLLALYEAGQILGSTLEREEIGSNLLQIMQRVSKLSAAVINLRDDQGQLRVRRAIGSESLRHWAQHIPEAQAARQAVLETEEHRSFRLPHAGPDKVHLAGLYIPLRVRDRLTGMLEAYGPEALAEEQTVGTLVSLTSQAASALENGRLYGELAERERQLRDLVGRLLTAQEEERRRVAYDVHDVLTQVAVAAYQHLQAFADDHPPDSARGQEQLEQSLELAQQTVREARRVIAGLRPTALDDFGLATAIRSQVEELRSEGWQVGYEETLGDERLPAALETALFRIAQEALTNVRKHAQTTRVDVTLQRLKGIVRLQVEDRGRGFQPTETGNGGGPGEMVGLSSMQERAALLGGDFEVRSKPGGGTTVVANVPLPAAEEDVDHEE